jgi:small subunit ribosomal protein S18
MSDEVQQSMDGAERGPGFGRDKDAAPEGRFKGRKRRKVSYLTINKIDTVDYKDINILRRFINDRGKILPSRQTGNTAKQQRMITRAINRARELALLPFVVQEMGSDRKEYAPRRDRGDRPYRDDRGPREERGPREAAPVEATPVAEAPVAEAPVVEAPAAEAPVVEAPTEE